MPRYDITIKSYSDYYNIEASSRQEAKEIALELHHNNDYDDNEVWDINIDEILEDEVDDQS